MIKKRPLKETLSVLKFDDIDEDPVSCKNKKWKKIIPIINIGKIKCKEKNRFSVGSPTEKSPQIQKHIWLPTKGKTEIKLVITVVAQNDIWPQGRTYPRKEVNIMINIIKTPEVQVLIILKDLLKKFLKIWRYIKKNKKEAPLAWKIRIIAPFSTFRAKKITDWNANFTLGV